MPILGAHMSVSGGLHQAIAAAVAIGMDTVQIFTTNPSRWAVPDLKPEVIADWHTAYKTSGLTHPIAHASYLINLAAQDDLYRKSVDGLVAQWKHCELLQLRGLVVHPGAFTTTSESEGISQIARGIVEAISRVTPKHCRLLLENTAGQGTCLGHRIEHLSEILKLARREDKSVRKHVGVCIDTCHAFAAGYEVNHPDGLNAFCDDLNRLLPKSSVRAMHLNDSKKPLGSRVDRHEHIGLGHIGIEGFRYILAHPMFADVPGYLETEKGRLDDNGLEWDAVNLQALRSVSP